VTTDKFCKSSVEGGSIGTHHAPVTAIFHHSPAQFPGSPPSSLPRLRSPVTRAASLQIKLHARIWPVMQFAYGYLHQPSAQIDLPTGSTGAANAAPPLAARFCRSLHRDGHGLGILWIARNIQQHKNRWLKLAIQHLALDRSHNVL